MEGGEKMNYYIRYNNQTMGPFAEEQIINFLQQGRFNDSVRFSADLSRWYPAWEISAFRNIPLQQAPASSGDVNFPRSGSRTRKSTTKDHSVLYFMGFCLVAILGFVAIIYAINRDDSVDSDGDASIEVKENFTADSLPAVYQKKQRAIGLVTMSIQDKKGNVYGPVAIGTAFAISKNKFVTNAHVAYAVKTGFEDFVDELVEYIVVEQAKKKGISPQAHANNIGERGIAQIKTRLLDDMKKDGVRVKDVEIRLNHSQGKSFRVAKVQVHTRYQPNGKITGEFDVAIFEIAGETNCYFNIASQKELYSLRVGMPVASAGFPATKDLSHIDKPEATFDVGIIKQITDFENKDAGKQHNKSIVHSIPAVGGSSGSPIFTSSGKVVAVLWGGHMRGSFQQIKAVRIDQLEGVGEAIDWKEWIYDPTKNISYSGFQREPTAVTSSNVVAASPARRTYDTNDDYANAKAEYDRLVAELNTRNKKLAETLNAYDAVKLLAQMAVLSGNVSPDEIFKLNKKMKELDLAIEQEKAALSRLNARKEELRLKYNF